MFAPGSNTEYPPNNSHFGGGCSCAAARVANVHVTAIVAASIANRRARWLFDFNNMRIILRISKMQNQVFRADPTGSSPTQVQDGMPHGQGGTTTVLVSNVTAPVRARALPFNVAPVVMVMDA